VDSVGVTRRVLREGDPIGQTGLIARQPLPRGHKVALRDVALGQEIRKFGQVIGLASASSSIIPTNSAPKITIRACCRTSSGLASGR